MRSDHIQTSVFKSRVGHPMQNQRQTELCSWYLQECFGVAHAHTVSTQHLRIFQWRVFCVTLPTPLLLLVFNVRPWNTSDHGKISLRPSSHQKLTAIK